MNLNKLFEMQRVLDERIVKEKGLEGQDLLPKKILALQVELGECANEHRGFKFWSNNQNARTKIEYLCTWCQGEGEYEDSFGVYDCSECGGNPVIKTSNPLLEEYVDCLHFILSIGLELEELDITKIEEVYSICEEETLTDVFRVTFMCTSEVIDDQQYWFNRLWTAFTYLGEQLGFTWEQIEAAYMEKNQTNHNRQSTGY